MSQDRPIYYDPGNDYYRVLGVRATASIDDIRRAYRQRAKEVHPDLHPEQEARATIKFQQISEAYEVLGDPALKKEYDKQRHAYLSQAFAPPPRQPAPPRRARVTWRTRTSRVSRGIGCYILIYVFLMVGNALFSSRSSYDDSYSGYPFGYSTLVNLDTLLTLAPRTRPTEIMPPCTDPNVHIDEASLTTVRGTAAGAGFASYDVEWSFRLAFETGRGTDLPQFWNALVTGVRTPIQHGVLYQSADGGDQTNTCALYGFACLVRLTVHDQDGTSRECQVMFYGLPPDTSTPSPQ